VNNFSIRSILGLTAVAVASLAFVQFAAAGTDRQARATAQTIQVSGGEFFFKLSTKSIAKPGQVTFVVKNIGHVAHNFKIDGKTTPLLNPGATARLTVAFAKKGKYPYLCTVPGHAAAGMEGVLTVR
jgi:uncharacterized cupredoxin-like copper-binding protein